MEIPMNINVNFKQPNKNELDALVEKLKAKYGFSNYSVAIRYAVHRTVLFFEKEYPLMDNTEQKSSVTETN